MSKDEDKEVCVGIDLGSWNSRVSYFDPSTQQPVLVNNHDGLRYTRSNVTVEDEEKSVMEVMQQQEGGAERPQVVVDFVQFLLELACDATHASVGKLKVVMSLPYDSTKELQERIPKCLPKPVSTCVGVISEPAAVTMAYEPSQPTVIVVDGGASGLKVTKLYQKRNGSSSNFDLVTVQQYIKEDAVSGPILVDTLSKFVAQQFETKHRFPKGEVWSSKKAKKKLYKNCEPGLTTLLRNQNSVTIHVDGLYEGMDCQVSVSKPRFDMLTSNLISKTKAALEQCREADMSMDNTAVLLTGSLHAWLRPIVQSVFPSNMVVPSTFDPTEAVALGCSKQAYWNINSDQIPKKPHFSIDQEAKLSPISIGISTSQNNNDNEDGSIQPLIPVGSPLPAFVTHEPMDNSVSEFALWQVEPTKRKLAVLQNEPDDNDGGPQPLVLELLTTGQLTISIGSESVRII